MSRKPEQLMWDALRKSVGPLWHATRHEDILSEGIPDVSWGSRGVQGWLELKRLPSWPKNRGTVVSIPHEERWMRQRTWIRMRGPGCWLVLRVGKEWLLFSWQQAQSVGYLCKESTIGISARTWNHVPDGASFVDAITRQAGT